MLNYTTLMARTSHILATTQAMAHELDDILCEWNRLECSSTMTDLLIYKNLRGMLNVYTKTLQEITHDDDCIQSHCTWQTRRANHG